MSSAPPRILTVNGGSSNITFALFAADQEQKMIAKMVCRVLGLGMTSAARGADSEATI